MEHKSLIHNQPLLKTIFTKLKVRNEKKEIVMKKIINLN